MRVIFLASLVSLAAASVQAGSIDVVKSDDVNRSIDFVTCAECPALKTKIVEEPEVTLKPGTQTIEVRKVNGELKVFRTEAWLGGSPVTFVSKASGDLIIKQSAENVPADDPKAAPVLIDKDATTSAVSADMDAQPAIAEKPKQVQALDPQTLQLRLN